VIDLDFHGRQVVVMGLGRSGRAAATLAARRGGHVIGLDLREDIPPMDGIQLELGPHRSETLLQADYIIVSPGIPASSSHLQSAIDRGIPVVGELGLAAQFLDAPMVAVTGTNGKSTVTSFVGQLLEQSGQQVFVGGNIGNALSLGVLRQDQGERFDTVVVEVSSYQMEFPNGFHPRAGVVLNVTPDHLARHGTISAYAEAKTRIFNEMGSGDFAVVPAGDGLLDELTSGVSACRVHHGGLPGVMRGGNEIQIKVPKAEFSLSLETFTLPGEHNKDNAAVACLLAFLSGASPRDLQQGLGHLTALPHRMEVVAEQDGVVWINDSKATNIASTKAAVHGIKQSAVVLLGGQAKGTGFKELAALLGRHRGVITFGESGGAIAAELSVSGLSVIEATDLENAIQLARKLAKRGDVVLLSPGCASFDEFENFEERGKRFVSHIEEGI
jgi:UDP-N-acetylmuramoylalanine--D-glutamate ligase